MRIKVPAMVELYPPMMGGLQGLGQCDPTTDPSCVSIPTFGDTSSTDISNLPIDTTPVGPLSIPPVSPASGPSLEQILAQTAQAVGTGAQVYRSLQNPSLIAGTGLVYNPATGQILNQAGITAAGVYPIAQTVASSISSMTPVLLLGGVLVLILVLGRR